MDHDPERIARRAAGPERLPHLLRILEYLRVNPAKLAVALHYSQDETTFWRLMSSALCVEEQICLQNGREGAGHIHRRLIRLDVDAPSPSANGDAPHRRGRFTSPLQERFAWFLGQKMKGRTDQLREETGLTPATLRRYGRLEGALECRSGPQSVASFASILRALKVNPAKLFVAAHYGGDDDSFWMIMSSTLCAEETLRFRGPDGQCRAERKLHRLTEMCEPLGRPFTAGSRGRGL